MQKGEETVPTVCLRKKTSAFLVENSVRYDELWNARCRAYRNGRWRFLGNEDKGLLNSAIAYLRRGCKIVNTTVIARLRVVRKKIEAVNKLRVLLDGEIKAMEMDIQCARNGVFKWVPRLKTWLRDMDYKLWLGTIQLSLEEFYPVTGLG